MEQQPETHREPPFSSQPEIGIEARRLAIDAITGRLPTGRYRGLARGVLRRLPESWDLYRTVSIELSGESTPRGYGSAGREEEGEGDERVSLLEGHNEQVWTVRLYPALLDPLSDEAVCWVIAHELGHVASGMACGSIVLQGRPYTRSVSGGAEMYREVTNEERAVGEKLADAIARAWGFWLEEEAFEAELSKQ